MKPVILGMVWKMRFEALQTFVYSLRRANYAGAVCFFVSELDQATIAALQRQQVEVLPVPRQPPGAALPPMSHRFLIYRDFLLARPTYTHAMLSDIRDVAFQRDPFDFACGDRLCGFLEDRQQTIASSPFNAHWIRYGFGEAALASIGHNPISCAGVSIGGRQAMLDYLEQMAKALQALTVNLHGIDQGVHNYLLWKGFFKDIQIFENGRGPVLTLGYVDPKQIKFNPQGEVIDDTGGVVNILHQFDRHPLLQTLLQARFSAAEADVRAQAPAPAVAGERAAPGGGPGGPAAISPRPQAVTRVNPERWSGKRVALIYDNTLRPETTGEYCRRALQPLCDLTHYLPTQLGQIPAGYDLYLHIDDGLGYSLPPHLRPSAWWVIDTHLQYARDLVKARTFDFVFAAQKDGAERLRADGVAQARWLPLACDPAIHGRRDVSKQYDVGFVGNVSFGPVSPGCRVEMLTLIRDHFPNVYIGKAFFEEMARIYSASKIAFNCSIRNDLNMRVFEALASGSLLVTNNLDDNGLAELFTDGQHLVTYGDGPDLLAKVRYYLAHEAEREQIARQGYAEVTQHHTYGHRMQTVLEICLGKKDTPVIEEQTVTPRHAAETLKLLLEADDLPVALEQLADRFDADLVALVRSNAAAARAEGDADLAEGLENLAEHIAQRLAAAAPEEAAPRRAAETLKLLLEADDLPVALEQLADRFDADLVALVRSNAAAARAEGDANLAEGLENLAEHIAQRLAAAAPAPAEKALSQYYSFARPEVARLVPPTARRVLDVGCGGGALGALLKARGHTEVAGIEINPEAAAVAAGRLDRVLTLDLSTLAELPYAPGYFDCIIFADVLEHLPDPAQVVRRLMPYLHPEGCLVISLPNIRHYTVVYDLLINGQWRYASAGILDRTHLRFFTWAGVQAFLLEAGLSGETVEPVLTAPDAALEPLLQAVAAARGDAEQARLELCTYQFVLRARPLAKPEAKPATPAAVEGLVSIILLTLNNLAVTAQCLASIHAHTPPDRYEVIVVDNGSTDGTVEFLRQYADLRPEVRVIVNAANRGFAGGNNQGLALARGQYLLFLNNDTVVTDGWLERMLAVFEQHPETGVVGPVSNFVAGPQQVSPVPYKTAEEMQAFAQRWAAEHAGQSERTLRVIGFCLMARRAVIDAIGGWDERFGSGNFEDDDFCLRVAYAHFHTRIARDAFVHHIGRQTFTQVKIDYVGSMERNWQIFKAKWGLPPETSLEAGYRLSPQVPLAALQPVALPNLAAEHQSDAAGRWWQPRAGGRSR